MNLMGSAEAIYKKELFRTWFLRQWAELDKREGRRTTPHDFRRAFALNCLRNGMDLMTLARLMGHTTIKVLKRYVALTDVDLRNAHEKASPVDNADF